MTGGRHKNTHFLVQPKVLARLVQESYYVAATDHADPVRLLLGTYLAYILASRLLVHILGNTYVVMRTFE